MNKQTEIMSAPEIKQSAIATEVYDRRAQFYEYREAIETKTIVEKDERPRKRFVLNGSLAMLGAVFLLSGLAAAFYYFSGNAVHSPTTNQVSAENLPDAQNTKVSTDSGEDQQTGLEGEKAVKPKSPDEKVSVVKKPDSEPTETKTRKTVEPKVSNSLPDRNSNIETKTTNSTLSGQTVQNDQRRELSTNPVADKTRQIQPTLRQNQRETTAQNNSGSFQDLPPNRKENPARKIKQISPEQRRDLKERLRNQKRRN